MRYLLFISHGTLAEGMTEALRMLVGERDDVLRAAFKDGMGLPEFKEDIQRVIAPVSADDELIVMADLVSGSPLATTMATIAEKMELTNVRAIGGMSLPLAITAVENEDEPLDETVEAMIACASEQVKLFDPNAGEDESDDI
ncbi:MAG: hypothetical protein K2O18_17600 [Oscillospiraceae bacterium]|nr:hypothetical protein [Oscillospiraceae bacterium]